MDVQVDLEIALRLGPDAEAGAGAAERRVRARRQSHMALERAGSSEQGVRDQIRAAVRPGRDSCIGEGVQIVFDGCESLGAANLRGTGFAAKDVEVRSPPRSERIGGVWHDTEVNVTGLAGFLLAKCAAAYSRRKTKDWYDIAFVLLHNDAGGPEAAAQAVLDRFGEQLARVRTALDDLAANFADPEAQGPRAYAQQMAIDHPEVDRATALADAVTAVESFCGRVKAGGGNPGEQSSRADPRGAA